jgi:hypothetical protein
MGIVVTGVDMVYLTQQQNVMDVPQLASVVPSMGMVIVNPAEAQIDQQQNPLIEQKLTDTNCPEPNH